MKRVAVLVLVLLVFVPAAAAAQTRKGAAAGRPTTAKAAAARRAAAERIAGQISTFSNYLYVYGSVVKGIQTSEQTAQGGPLPPATQALIQKNKAGIADSMRNLQDGLRRLEMDLSEDPALKDYYVDVNKLSEDVGLAADAAAAGKYDDAGKRLIAVVDSLARALLPETK